MKSRRQCELILYNETEDYTIFNDKLRLKCNEYKPLNQWAFILHDKDDKKPHYHLMLKFKNPVPDNAIINHFEIKPNQIEKIKGKWTDALQYLTHKNAMTKHQYNESEIISNFDVSQFVDDKLNEKNVLDRIVKYSNNEITFYDLWTTLSPHDKIKYNKNIDIANKTRIINITMKGNRNMKVYYVYGATGSGKTTFAKWFSEKVIQKPYFVSGSSNDVLDGYMGQPIIILDDLRDDSFKFHDLLKFLDNHTSSLVKSRYYNKAIDCEMIVITSTKLLSDMYSNIQNEDKLQLYRRINEVVSIHDDNSITSKKIDIESSRNLGKLLYQKQVMKLPSNIKEIYDSLEIIKENAPSIADMIQQNLKGAS